MKSGISDASALTSGTNRIVQTVKLPEGDYRLLIDMRYECPNQQSNDGSKVVASGNTNTSYTGVKYGTKTDYRYPAENNTWEVMVYDFSLNRQTNVEISLGFTTSTSAGAANNTLLYIDNVRLLSKNTTPPNDVDALQASPALVDVYSVQGIRLHTQVPAETATQGLPKGLYLVDGQKVLISD